MQLRFCVADEKYLPFYKQQDSQRTYLVRHKRSVLTGGGVCSWRNPEYVADLQAYTKLQRKVTKHRDPSSIDTGSASHLDFFGYSVSRFDRVSLLWLFSNVFSTSSARDLISAS